MYILVAFSDSLKIKMINFCYQGESCWKQCKFSLDNTDVVEIINSPFSQEQVPAVLSIVSVHKSTNLF